MLALTAQGTTVSTLLSVATASEANHPWQPEGNVTALPGKTGLKPVDRGLWPQPDTQSALRLSPSDVHPTWSPASDRRWLARCEP